MNRRKTVYGAAQRRLTLEGLENRDLLAGNVTANVIGGTLFIRGDNAGNGVIVSQTGDNEYSVTGFDFGGGGTRIKTNGNGNGPTNNTLFFSGVTGNIDIDLKKGDDAIGVGNDESELNAQFIDCFDTPFGDGEFDEDGEETDILTVAAVAPGTLEVPRDLIINTGDGVDQVAVAAQARDGAILTGNQDDLVSVHGSFFSDDLIVDTGKGDDGVCVEDTGVTDLLSVVTAQGSDGVDVVTSILGTLSVVTGDGFDSVDVVNVETRFSVAINTGNGGSEVDVFESSIGQSLTIVAANGQDQVSVGIAGVGGALAIATGNDADDVRLNQSSINLGVSVVTGNGNDEVHLSEFEALAVAIDTGNGNDGSFGEESPITVEDAFIELDLSIATGNGNDLILVANTSCRTAVLNSGDGDDQVRFDESTTAWDLIVTTLKGEDFVDIQGDEEEDFADIGRDLIINTGKNDDEVDITDTIVRRNAVVSLGDGADAFFASFLDILGNATLDAGAGNDQNVEVNDSNVGGLFQAFMGAGDDHLSIFGGTAGTARLFGGENRNDSDVLDTDNVDAEVFDFEDININ